MCISLTNVVESANSCGRITNYLLLNQQGSKFRIQQLIKLYSHDGNVMLRDCAFSSLPNTATVT